ncbi:hypothetical protein, partial [Escherichia coli]|uniref:hypothetical protein n=1 Tax=Escherichia coli TaxID=562 RepID=UPI001BDBA899
MSVVIALPSGRKTHAPLLPRPHRRRRDSRGRDPVRLRPQRRHGPYRARPADGPPLMRRLIPLVLLGLVAILAVIWVGVWNFEALR